MSSAKVLIMCFIVIIAISINLNNGTHHKHFKSNVHKHKKHHQNDLSSDTNPKSHHFYKHRVKNNNNNKMHRRQNNFPIHRDFVDAQGECQQSRQLVPRIINGPAAPTNMFPWMVAIYMMQYYSPDKEPFIDSDALFICGGSLITPNFILTAAHCFREFKSQKNVGARDVMVRLGDYNIQSPFDDPERGVIDSAIDQLFIYRDYNWRSYTDDIALLKMKRRVDYSQFIRPICVPNLNWRAQLIYPGDDVIVAGWGYRYADYGYPGELGSALRMAEMSVYESGVCDEVLLYQKNPQRTICVAKEGGPGSSKPCVGDSGGPLMPLRDRSVLAVAIGVVSFGSIPCNHPTIFTKVQFYSNWINNIVSEYA